MMQNNLNEPAGILLVNKPKGKTSFSLVAMLRRILKVKKIGHAGTLDPFATGVMVMLVGKQYTRMSDQFLCQDKEYIAKVHLGIITDTYDIEGQTIETSNVIPSLKNVKDAIEKFQGSILQVPPMFSAKKVNGKKLYELARNGVTIERTARQVHVKISFLSYEYPYLDIHVSCSKGTYIRSLAYDIGLYLGCGAHLAALQRTRSGSFLLEKCIDGALLQNPTEDLNISAHLIQNPPDLSL
jgi:tRNA pseudouridine55 synthase